MSKKKETAPEQEVPVTEAETAAPEAAETPAAETAPSPEEALTAELAETKDKYLRLAAEYENFRRRTQKEKEAIYGDAQSRTVESILPVIDNLDRAVGAASAAQDLDAFKQGVEMTLRQFLEILEKLGVKEIPAQGERFDPNVHHAVMHIDDESIDEQTVVEVFQKGYALGDRVIRPAMVKVAN